MIKRRTRHHKIDKIMSRLKNSDEKIHNYFTNWKIKDSIGIN